VALLERPLAFAGLCAGLLVAEALLDRRQRAGAARPAA
jgi:hypothetical protein